MKFYTNNFIEYIYKEIYRLLLVSVNNRLKFEIEIVHDLSCHPILVLDLFAFRSRAPRPLGHCGNSGRK